MAKKKKDLRVDDQVRHMGAAVKQLGEMVELARTFHAPVIEIPAIKQMREFR